MALVERGPEAEWPLTAQAQLLSLNRSSLYYRPVIPSAEELALKRRIDELFRHIPSMGCAASRRSCGATGCWSTTKQ